MKMSAQASAMPVAVVGIGAIFPGRGDATGFWRDIYEGRDLITDTPASHWLVEDYFDPNPLAPDRTYGRRGGFLSPVAFDPMAFGIPPNAVQTTDTAQLLALIAAKATLDDVEADCGGKFDRTRTSVILGVASATELTAHMAGRLQRPTWVNALRQSGLPESEVQAIANRIENHYTDWKESTFPGLLGNVVAGRIANRLDLGGSNYVTDAACASSLSALQIALHELRAGDSDMVLTGGVDALNDILMFMCFSKTPALSPTGDCRPFSTKADGTMLSEGIGMVALRRLDDAIRDRNNIYAVVRGLGGGSDGRGTAIYTPLPEGQSRALRRAYQQAGYGPDTVDLVEAHGTGTKAGDRAELEGLHLVFNEARSDATQPWCAIGSVKSQIGHAKGAAGAASLLKAVQSLSRKVLPPTIKIEEPAEVIQESGCFYVNTEARPWITPDNRPRRASISSFGFGGSNFHVALEEYTGPGAVQPPRTFSHELFLVHGGDAAKLGAALSALADSTLPEGGFAAVAETTHASFDPAAPARAALVASDGEDLAAKARRIAAQLADGTFGRAPLPAGCAASTSPSDPGKVAFLFSGQGSQYVGMGADLAMNFPAARAVWDMAASHEQAGPLGLHRLAFPPAAFDQVEFGRQTQRLTAMHHAQPAIAAVALSHLALLGAAGIRADMTAGHSFGEIMALHLAGAFDSSTALTIAAARGRLMAEAAEATEGAMLAVQCDAATIAPVVASVGAGLVIANDNGPSQVVLSGTLPVIDKAVEACAASGLKATRLQVATAFHSDIVSPAVAPFTEILSTLKLGRPRVPVYANATAAPYREKAKDLANAIATQVATPVRFRDMVSAMYEAGARTFIEVGPGNIVTGLVNDIVGTQPVLALALDNKRTSGLAQFLHALGALSVAGHDIDFTTLLADTPAPKPRPAPSKHAIMISGANHDRPYPPKDGAAGRAPPNAERTTPATQPPPQPAFAPTRNPDLMTDSAPPPATRPIITPAQAAPGDAALVIWQQVSDRHQDYLNATTAAHTAYLNAAAAILGAGTALTARTVYDAPRLAAPATTPPPPAPVPDVMPHAKTNGAAGHAVAKLAASLVPTAPPVRPVVPTSAPPSAKADVPATSGSGSDASSLVRSIVSEKTGYPDEMLDVDMDLEGELGVDSIKQVEILSTLRERLPSLPEIDPERLVELRTISAIAAMIESSGAMGAPVRTSTPPVMAPAHAANGNGHADGNASGVSAEIVRALIAEKTGYPVDMLEDDMDLEGELGVDSIKQVEILSSLRERFPSLPEVDPEYLAEMRTIRKIADFFA